jgi:oligosaccharide repeat unit polymerase
MGIIAFVVVAIPLSLLSLHLARQLNTTDLFSPPLIISLIFLLQIYVPAITLPFFGHWTYYEGTWVQVQITQSSIAAGILLTSLAWVVYLITYKYSGTLGKHFGKRLPFPKETVHTKLLSLFLASIGLLMIFIILKSSSGIFQIIIKSDIIQGTGLWVHFIYLCLPGIFYLSSLRRWRLLSIVTAIAFTVLFLAASRREVALAILIQIFILIYYVDRIDNRSLVLKGLMLLAFGMIVVSMGGIISHTSNLQDIIEKFELYFIDLGSTIERLFIVTLNKDISRIEPMAFAVILVPEVRPYLLGVPMFIAFFGPFAKFFFPDVGPGWETDLTMLAYGVNTELGWNLAFNGVGDWYVNFGVLGVILGWFLLGLFSRISYEWFLFHKSHSAVVFAYLPLLRAIWTVAMMGTWHIMDAAYSLPFLLLSFRWFVRRPTKGSEE